MFCAVKFPVPVKISVPNVILPPDCTTVLPSAVKVPLNIAFPVEVTVILLYVPETAVVVETTKFEITVKLPELLVEPAGVVTETVPVVVPVATTALIWVELITVNEEAAVPLKLTAVAPVRFVPLIVTVVPTPPEDGLIVVMVGNARTVKLVALVPVPDPFTTVITPVVAPAGTVAEISVTELTV